MKALLCTEFGGIDRLQLKEVAPPKRVPLAGVPTLMSRMAARQIMGKAIVLPEAA